MTAGYLRPEDASRYLGVSPRTLRDWMARGLVAFHKPCKRVVLFSVADLDRAMARFRVTAVGEVSP